MSDLSDVRESSVVRQQMVVAGEIEWLAEDEVPKAAVTLLSGEPGSGKSFVACTLAASVSQVPDARLIFAHSDPAERLRMRLNHAGAEASRIALLGGGGQGIGDRKGFSAEVGGQGAGTRERFGIQDSAFRVSEAPAGAKNAENPSKSPKIPSTNHQSPATSHQPPATSQRGFAQRLEVLIAWLTGATSVSRADLIVVDDLETFLGKALSAAELAEATARLNELARTSGAAVLAVVRSATTTEGRVTARSLDRLMRAADVVWMVATDRETTGHRWLVALKNNLAALSKGKTFQIVEGCVQWLNEAVPDDALAPGSRRSLERIDRQTAGAWLVEALLLQDVPSKLLYAQARQCGFSRNTILRAAHRMGLHSHKCAFDGGWKYSLRDVPREVVERFKPPVKAFGGQRLQKASGFRVQDSARSEEPSDVEIAENRSKNPNTEGNREQVTGNSEGFGIQGPEASVPLAVGQAFQPDFAPPAPAPAKKPLGPRTLPPGVPPEPELRDHLGRIDASTAEKWGQWYHQWHREIREFNRSYQFER